MTKPRETEASLQQMIWGDMGVRYLCHSPKPAFQTSLGIQAVGCFAVSHSDYGFSVTGIPDAALPNHHVFFR